MRELITVGFDPGKSCGLSVLSSGRGMFYHQGPADRALETLDQVLTHLRSSAYPDIVTIYVFHERYIVPTRGRPRTQETDALRVIGAFEHVLRMYALVSEAQNPADVKAFAKNDLLRKLGLYLHGSDVHQPDANDVNDATRHAVFGLAKRAPRVYDELLRAHGL